MRYFGSKVSVIQDIYKLISKKVPDGTFCDAFGGIGTVGSYFKEKGYSVWTGDNLTSAHYFQIARVQLNNRPRFMKLRRELGVATNIDVVELLNNERPQLGWITKQFCEERPFFTKENAKRIDACRLLINRWSYNGWLTNTERAVLLASLMTAMGEMN